MGFEMAYIPAGTYYIASAQQVIAEEHRGQLHESKPVDNPIYAHVKVDQNDKPLIKKTVVNFPFDSFIPLDPKKVKSEIKQFEGQSIKVVGYASREGDAAYNKMLSKKRAKKVAQIAIKLGVKVESIKAVGESQCNVKTAKNYPKCRKVEVVRVDGEIQP